MTTSRLTARDQAQRLKWSIEGWKEVYFWTFTIAQEEHDVRVILRRFSRWLDKVRREFPEIKGVRIPQAFPRGHGWHIHAIFDTKIPHQRHKRFAKQVGLGRTDFKKVRNREKAIDYITRYISRDCTKRTAALKGVRMVEAIGARPRRAKGEVNGAAVLFGEDSTPRWWKRLVDLEVVSTGRLYRRHLLEHVQGRVAIPQAIRRRGSIADVLRLMPEWMREEWARTLTPELHEEFRKEIGLTGE